MDTSFSRRDLFGVLAGVLWTAGCAQAFDGEALQPPLVPVAGPGPTLRDICRSRGIRHGAARDHVVLPDDPELDRLMAQECDLVVPENGGKWAVLQPQEGNWDWRRFDRAVADARAIGAVPAWHCMLWQHMGMPEYMKLPIGRMPELRIGEPAYFSPEGTLAPENHWRRFTGYAAAVRERYGDAFWRIDVANEVFFWETGSSHPHQQDAHGFRRGMWWVAAGGDRGPEWLDPFFHHARRTFPSAKLVINDFGIELAEGWQQRKRAYLLRWLTDAVKRGVPIDGLGLQSHLFAGKPYDRDGMRTFLRAVDKLGIPVHVTELDVDERHLPRHWSREDKDRAIAWTAQEYLRDVAANATLVEVTWWHLRSDLNWLASELRELKPNPSPFDATSQPLPLYHAAARALEGAARRA
ncbi:endo-1,4-beta-xylanase [Azospirillum sp. TSO22-1]|uniref:endo-1,4-beta-xylanase n=1 Tax=Azospirillum sp. TSO22-1 TaxID=716789 RepID=UPI000D65C8F9|nr:endo-1,4-beta-xylanase [Azospirillum sp. TSO22-1]